MTKCGLLRGAGLILMVGLAAGCATAPTQEMSDARQAVQAARDAGAPVHTPVAMDSAELDLSNAEHNLSKRDYDTARDEAVAAKQQAMKARNMALAIADAKKVVTEADEMGALTQVTRDWLAQAESASSKGDEQEVMRTAQRATQEAQDDIRRFKEEQQRVEQENQSLLDKTMPLLDEAHQAEARLTAEQQDVLRRGEAAYQKHDGRQAYDLINPLVEQVRALPPLPITQQYQVMVGDNLWRIAAKPSVYGNPLWWPLIYRSNQAKIRDADRLIPGQLLTIDKNPVTALVNMAVKYAERREGTPEQSRQLDEQFLRESM